MGDNYNYNTYRHALTECPNNKELLPPRCIIATSAQMISHNMHLQSLTQYTSQLWPGAGRPTMPTFRKDMVLPISANLDVAQGTSNVLSKRYEDNDRLTISATAYPTSLHLSHSTDVPIDLSQPKPSNSSREHNSNSSRLMTLLSRKRNRDASSGKTDIDVHEQTRPLNLSKRACPTNSIIHLTNQPAHQSYVVDMKDAIDNPVQLVQLLNVFEVTGKVKGYINHVSTFQFDLLIKISLNLIFNI